VVVRLFDAGARLVEPQHDGSALGEGGREERVVVPADVWLSGATRHTTRVAATPRVLSVELDPDKTFPDLVRANDRWSP